MSRQNKVNPGIYTQRGRLTQDDAARELRKQSAIGSPRSWQPVNTKSRPRPAPARDAARDTERSTTVAPSNATVKAAKAKTARTRQPKRTTGKAQAGKAMTTAMKRTTPRPTRTAVLARNVDGGAALRPTTKRRKG